LQLLNFVIKNPAKPDFISFFLVYISNLREIDISDIPLAVQQKIVELNQLQVKEKILLSCLMKEKDKFAKASINKIIMED
jgi:hypothetical protein